MSALETDLNPNTYIGLKLPIKNSSNLDFDMTKTSLEQSKFNITNLLLTNTGERVYQPEFGSRLRELIFEQIDENLPNKIEEEVRRAVSRWLPYINIQDVQTLSDDGNKNKVFVQVSFSTILNSDTYQSITLDAGFTTTTY
mgnify:CR=1 FL=1